MLRRLQMGMWNHFDNAGWEKYHLNKINGIECGFADNPQLVTEKELLLCYEQVDALFTQSDEKGGKEFVTRNLPKNL